MLYRLISPEQGDDKRYQAGYDASRIVSVYPGENCAEVRLYPWYGFGCWSDGERFCGATPYGIKSFSVPLQYDKPDGKCMTFPEARQKNSATSGLWSFQAALAAVTIASVMVV